MKKDAFSTGAPLDAATFARAGRTERGIDSLRDYQRLVTEAVGPASEQPVQWSAHGELRIGEARAEQPWLHLQADTLLPMTCQRCLEPVAVQVAVDRWFRFVRDEATAALEDEEAEEDVLALTDHFRLRQLIEDELLLALPVVPMHEQCPIDVKLAALDPDFEDAAAPEHPFAGLQRLREHK